MSEAMIEVDRLVVRYGAATALDHVSLTVGRGEMVALIGPNGAGKSTLINALSGILIPAGGRLAVRGRLAHVPEGRQLFPDFSVDDNLQLGARRNPDRDTAWVYEFLPALAPRRHQRAGTLSGGQQQMVAIGRALMSQPDTLAIDELSLGLAPKVVADLAQRIARLHRERGLTVLLIEQNAQLALDLCSRAYVLEAGRIVAEGPSAVLANSPEVARAYLGTRLVDSA
jgi:branched-chain amino acid transport system ATP-binding protein